MDRAASRHKLEEYSQVMQLFPGLLVLYGQVGVLRVQIIAEAQNGITKLSNYLVATTSLVYYLVSKSFVASINK